VDYASSGGAFTFNILVNGNAYPIASSPSGSAQGCWLEPFIYLNAGDVIEVEVLTIGSYEVGLTLIVSPPAAAPAYAP